MPAVRREKDLLPKIGIDVGIVNPQAAAHLHDSAERSLAAAEGYTITKREFNDTDRKCEQAGIDYQPIVIESFGAMTMQASITIHSLHQLVADNTNTPVQEVARRFWQRTSIDMQRSLHRAFARRLRKKELWSVKELYIAHLEEPDLDMETEL